MSKNMFCCRSAFSLLICLLAIAPVRGEKNLRWQLEPDQKYRLLVEWTNRTVTDEVEVTNTTACELLWVVKAVGLSDDYEISQSLSHVKQSLQTPDGALFQYDSNAAGETKGTTAFLAAYWKPLLGAERTFRMTPRGEVIRDGDNGQTAGADNELVSFSFGRDAWRDAFQSGAVVLPADAVQPQQVWTESQSLPLGDDVAKLTVTRSYTYEGEQTKEGEDSSLPLEIIRIANRFEIQPAEGQESPLSIVQQDGVGEILFDAVEGRLVTSKLDQNLSLKYVTDGREMTSRINATYKMTFQLLLKTEETTAEVTPAETTPAETTTAGTAASP